MPDQQRAVVFYVMGLGLTRDPYLVTSVDNAWINAGTCQFHLPVGPAQVLRGTTGLVMADLDALVARLDAVAPRLEGTLFAFTRAGTQVNVTCPWGNRIRVRAPDPDRFGRMTLGMPYVEIDPPQGPPQASPASTRRCWPRRPAAAKTRVGFLPTFRRVWVKAWSSGKRAPRRRRTTDTTCRSPWPTFPACTGACWSVA